jgi:two-component system, OmpR family, alkaline phosphatase synthesis response regulator PhoP
MSFLPRVILFDDEEANHKLLGQQFKDHFEFTSFINPHLYTMALKLNPTAILIDILMPVMDGFELHKKIEQHPDYNGCPILFISSSNAKEIILNAWGQGAQDFLSRQMSKEEMIMRIMNRIEFFNTNRHILKLGKVKINVPEIKLYSDGQVKDITLTEFKIMHLLIRRFPEYIPKSTLCQELWPNQKVLPGTVSTHLSNLRLKFSDWEFDIQVLKDKGVGLSIKA